MEVRIKKAQKLHDYIFGLPEDELKSLKNNPDAILDAIDKYTSEHERLMNVGRSKGDIICKELDKTRCIVMLELGCYFGYSAIMFSKYLSSEPESKYYTIEYQQKCIDIASDFVELAGLSNKIVFIQGKAAEQLSGLKHSLTEKQSRVRTADFIFIDHDKSMYYPDLRVMESLNLIAPGTKIVADNTSHSPTSDYCTYLNATPEERRDLNIRTPNRNGEKYTGRWNIIYATHSIYDPEAEDSVEITTCESYLSS